MEGDTTQAEPGKVTSSLSSRGRTQERQVLSLPALADSLQTVHGAGTRGKKTGQEKPQAPEPSQLPPFQGEDAACRLRRALVGKWGDDWPLLSCGAVGTSSAQSGSRRIQKSKGAPHLEDLVHVETVLVGNVESLFLGVCGLPSAVCHWVSVLMTFAIKDILSLQRLLLVVFHGCGPVGTSLSPVL